MKECCRFKLGKCASKVNPQEDENFAKDVKRPDGLTPHCKSCLKEYRERNKEQRNATIKDWRKRNPEKLKAYAKTKDALANARERKRRYILKCRYGIKPEDWQMMFEKQKGTCPICLRHATQLEEVLHTDHCHKSNKVRGLLCSTCNKMIGLAQENFEVMERAITYLKNGGCHVD